MATLEHPGPAPLSALNRPVRSRAVPVLALVTGILFLVGGLTSDLKGMAVGATVFALCLVIAAKDARGAAVFTWPNAVGLLVLVVWLLPIKRYRLPIDLPFHLEPYRLLIMILGAVLVGSLITGRRRLSAGGVGLPVAAIAMTVLVSQYVNLRTLDPLGGEIVALKGFLYMATYLLVFLLVCTAITDMEDVRKIVKVLVLGAIPVAIAAIIESRTHYNVFDHLDN